MNVDSKLNSFVKKRVGFPTAALLDAKGATGTGNWLSDPLLTPRLEIDKIADTCCFVVASNVE